MSNESEKKESFFRSEIVEQDGEEIYKVNIPELNDNEKAVLKAIEDRAIKELFQSYSKRERKKLVDDILRIAIDYVEMNKVKVNKEKLPAIAEMIANNMLGFGKLEPLLNDDDLEEVMVIGIGLPVYVAHRKLGTLATNIYFDDDDEIKRIIEKIARFTGRKIDAATPLLDARLPDGSRVNATLAPVSLDGSTITIRKFKAEALTIIDLIRFGTLTLEVAAFLWLAVEGLGARPSNILVSGGTGSGKTTTLNCLSLLIPKKDRVITIEDTAELQLPLKHKIRLETKPPNIEGRGGLDFHQLLINTLRMRPDRIILGEIRGREAETLFVAMNTGHDGCMGTVHANTASETITRLTNPPMNVPVIMIPALDLIIMQNRIVHKGKVKRRITEIAEIGGLEVDKVLLNRIYSYNPKLDTLENAGPSRLKQEIAKKAGVSIEEINKELKRRELLLECLVRKNIRALHDVYSWIQSYYKDSDATLERAAELLK